MGAQEAGRPEAAAQAGVVLEAGLPGASQNARVARAAPHPTPTPGLPVPRCSRGMACTPHLSIFICQWRNMRDVGVSLQDILSKLQG